MTLNCCKAITWLALQIVLKHAFYDPFYLSQLKYIIFNKGINTSMYMACLLFHLLALGIGHSSTFRTQCLHIQFVYRLCPHDGLNLRPIGNSLSCCGNFFLEMSHPTLDLYFIFSLFFRNFSPCFLFAFEFCRPRTINLLYERISRCVGGI